MLFLCKNSIYSRTSLVRTPGDRQNAFALSDILINRCHMYSKGFEGFCINRGFRINRVHTNDFYCTHKYLNYVRLLIDILVRLHNIS